MTKLQRWRTDEWLPGDGEKVRMGPTLKRSHKGASPRVEQCCILTMEVGVGLGIHT